MAYSFWIAFFLIIFSVIWKIRNTRAEYLREKAEEQRQVELEARTKKTTGEVLTRAHNQGQTGPTQGQIPDLSEMLGTHGQKRVN